MYMRICICAGVLFCTDVHKETLVVRVQSSCPKIQIIIIMAHIWINYITRLNKALHTRTNVNVDDFTH